jgi:uncharacterized HAD superfamily protein
MANEKTYKIFMIDMDGTICENIRNEEGVQRMAGAKPFQDSIDAVNKLHEEGHFICIFTARTDEHKRVTEDWLKAHNVKYDQILLNKPRKMGKYTEYHWIDDAKVRATTFTGKFSNKFVKKKIEIEVFDEQ